MMSGSWMKALVLVVATASLVAGCGAPGSRQQMGTGIGAVAGGMTGGLLARRNPVAGAVVGAVAGGLIGSAIGRALDQEERRQLALASELAAEQPVVPKVPPKKVQWKRTDPQTNTVTASGWVVPKIRSLSEGRHHLPRGDPERQQERADPESGRHALPHAGGASRRVKLGDPAIAAQAAANTPITCGRRRPPWRSNARRVE